MAAWATMLSQSLLAFFMCVTHAIASIPYGGGNAYLDAVLQIPVSRGETRIKGVR